MRLTHLLAVPTVALLVAVAGGPLAAGAAKEPETVVVKVDITSDVTIESVAADHGADVADVLIASRGLAVLTELDPDGHLEKDLKDDARVIWVDDFEPGETDDDSFHAWPTDANPTPYAQLGQGLAGLDLGTVHGQTTGAGVLVAVLDTGIDGSALLGRVVEGWDFVDDDGSPVDEANLLDDDGDGRVDEAHGHGTHVAGIIHQVAPGATILGYRVLDSDGRGSVYAMAEAIDDAVEAGADVINLSFGMDRKIKAKVVKDALKQARAAGVVIVAAAGNTGSDHKQYPAADKHVLSVTAYDDDHDEMPQFASHGNWVDVAAPGVGVASLLPGGRVAAWTGSSMATPVVAGQAALLLGADGTLEPKDIEKLIRDSARKLDHPNRPEKGLVDLLASLTKLQ